MCMHYVSVHVCLGCVSECVSGCVYVGVSMCVYLWVCGYVCVWVGVCVGGGCVWCIGHAFHVW